MPKVDVVIIGAGLAGLACARKLQSAGIEVVVLESSEKPGGRIQSDNIDGFILDHGFQVINPAYPELQSWENLKKLQLRPLSGAVEIKGKDKLIKLADPRRNFPSIRSHLAFPIRSQLEFLFYALSRTNASMEKLLSEPEMAFADVITSRNRRLYEEVLAPFFKGVFLQDPNSVSRNYGDLVLRTFVKGRPSLPKFGVGELPLLMAEEITQLKLNSKVNRIENGLVRSDSGDFSFSQLVFAHGDSEISGGPTFDQISWNRCTTFYHCADQSPSKNSAVRVNHHSPIVNSVVLSNASDAYAPPGKHLISTTTLSHLDENSLRKYLVEFWGKEVLDWTFLREYKIEKALPSQKVGTQLQKSQKIRENMWLIGDHRDTPSQQGALFSGRRCAESITSQIRSRVR